MRVVGTLSLQLSRIAHQHDRVARMADTLHKWQRRDPIARALYRKEKDVLAHTSFGLTENVIRYPLSEQMLLDFIDTAKTRSVHSSKPPLEALTVSRSDLANRFAWIQKAASWWKKASASPKSRGTRASVSFFEGGAQLFQKLSRVYKREVASFDDVARVLRAAGDIWRDSSSNVRYFLRTCSQWGTTELFRQISLFNTEYQTGFDPGSLAFSLRIHHDFGEHKADQLMPLALKILMKSQGPDGTWSTPSPFVLDPETGSGVYVANLEIANAVLRIIRNTQAYEYFPNMKRIYIWLAANKNDIRWSHIHIIGWPHDKAIQQDRIEVWMTALALEFLVEFSQLVQDVIRYRIQKRYLIDTPKVRLTAILDPELRLPVEKRLTNKIQNECILPFRTLGRSRCSALLFYGPPGTAKTTLASAIAAELGWPLVTITPSDFVREGIEQTDRRAREIFDDLHKLTKAVILFDEIDEMLRSRNRQGATSIFEFIIPGMLPRLQRLKQYGEDAQLLLIIATNFCERLDSAIVRRGRIDHRILIPPPDQSSRKCQAFRYLINSSALPERIVRRKALMETIATIIAEKTNGWVFKEIQDLLYTIEREYNPDYPLERWVLGRFSPARGTFNRGRYVAFSKAGDSGIGCELDLEKVYKDRLAARDEFLAVARLCLPSAHLGKLWSDIHKKSAV
jgi:adenylate kinase family enzyme